MSVVADRSCTLTVSASAVADFSVLTVHGVLDTTTYQLLRDIIIKAALEVPAAVVIDITDLDVPASSALAVFTSARWHVGRWPEVPILLVCAHRAGRDAITRNGVSRYVPVYAAVGLATAALDADIPARRRRRARARLPADVSSLRQSRELVNDWLTAWSRDDLIPAAKVVVTEFVENVLQHTDSAPEVRLETDGSDVTVAVQDCSHRPPALNEFSTVRHIPSGLGLVAALCRMWGNAPTSTGKTVWAVIGPENRL
jgi:anti-anti-sigma factor